MRVYALAKWLMFLLKNKNYRKPQSMLYNLTCLLLPTLDSLVLVDLSQSFTGIAFKHHPFSTCSKFLTELSFTFLPQLPFLFLGSI